MRSRVTRPASSKAYPLKASSQLPPWVKSGLGSSGMEKYGTRAS